MINFISKLLIAVLIFPALMAMASVWAPVGIVGKSILMGSIGYLAMLIATLFLATIEP